MPPEIGWRGGVRDDQVDGTGEDPGERGLPQAHDVEACGEGGGQPGQVPRHRAGTPAPPTVLHHGRHGCTGHPRLVPAGGDAQRSHSVLD